MTVFIIITLILVAAIMAIGAATSKKGNASSSPATDPFFDPYYKKEYDAGIKELHDLDEQYHQHLQYWKEFHAKYASLGEPTLRIGYPEYKMPMPWEYPTITVPYDKIEAEPEIRNRVDMMNSALSQMRYDHHIPAIGQCATFWQEARTAVLGREELHPEQIRFVKSNRNNPFKWIEVTVITNQLDRPTVSLIFEPDNRDKADQLKAAITAFKELPL